MNNIKLFDTEAEYAAAQKILPSVCFVRETNKVYCNAKHAVDRALNTPLMNLCVAKGWAKESEDYLTYKEASLITSITATDLVDYEITRLIEMKYFTGVTSINLNNTPVESFYLNNNCAAAFNNNSYRSNITYLKLADDIVSLNENSASHARINQYSCFYKASGSIMQGTVFVAGKNTQNSSIKYGGWIANVETVVLPYVEVLPTSSIGVIINKTTNVYVPDNLVDGYKETYSTNASKFHRMSEFVDPYPDY